MARDVLVDAGVLVALLSRRDSHHPWAVAQTPPHAPPWRTYEAVLSETFTFSERVGRRDSARYFAAARWSTLST
jgi:hypothetical protein